MWGARSTPHRSVDDSRAHPLDDVFELEEVPQYKLHLS